MRYCYQILMCLSDQTSNILVSDVHVERLMMYLNEPDNDPNLAPTSRPSYQHLITWQSKLRHGFRKLCSRL
jgi:hypothetical protein